MMWIFRRAKQWLETICLVLLLLSAASLMFTGIFTGKATIFGIRPMVVTTDSMVPTLSVGEIIIGISVEPEEIQVGDIVAYRADEKNLWLRDYLKQSPSYNRNKDINGLYNEVCGLNAEVSYEALCEAGDGELSEKMQGAILYHGGAVSNDPVVDAVIEKLDKGKVNGIAEEICDWEKRDREVAMYLMYRRYKGKKTYKDIAEYFHLPGGAKEANKLMMCGQRKLDKKYPGREYLDAMPD